MRKSKVLTFFTGFWTGTLNATKLEQYLNSAGNDGYAIIRSVREEKRFLLFWKRESHFLLFESTGEFTSEEVQAECARPTGTIAQRVVQSLKQELASDLGRVVEEVGEARALLTRGTPASDQSPRAEAVKTPEHIYLYRGEEQVGPYSQNQIRVFLKAGAIEESAPAWHEGMRDWQPLHEVMALSSLAADPPPLQLPEPGGITADSAPWKTGLKLAAVGALVVFLFVIVAVSTVVWRLSRPSSKAQNSPSLAALPAAGLANQRSRVTPFSLRNPASTIAPAPSVSQPTLVHEAPLEITGVSPSSLYKKVVLVPQTQSADGHYALGWSVREEPGRSPVDWEFYGRDPIAFLHSLNPETDFVNLVMDLRSSRVITTLGFKYPYFQNQNHGKLTVLWGSEADGCRFAVITNGGGWAPTNLNLVQIDASGVSQTNLLSPLTQRVMQMVSEQNPSLSSDPAQRYLVDFNVSNPSIFTDPTTLRLAFSAFVPKSSVIPSCDGFLVLHLIRGSGILQPMGAEIVRIDNIKPLAARPNLSIAPAPTLLMTPAPAAPPPAVYVATLPGEQYPQTRLRLLRPEDVQNWTATQLRYAINEMYARRGADFRDRELRRTFAQFKWYQPRSGASYDQTETLFTPLEAENLKLLGQFRDARKNGTNPVPIPVSLPGSNVDIPVPPPQATPAITKSATGPRYAGHGRIYKVPELKNLVGQKLDDAWIYGDFLLKGAEGNTGFFITTAIVLLPAEGSTQLQVEFPGGIQLSPAVLTALRDPMLVIPVGYLAKDPLKLVSVSRMSNGHLLVKARARGALIF